MTQSFALFSKAFIPVSDDALPTLMSLTALTHGNFSDITLIKWQRSIKKSQRQVKGKGTAQPGDILIDRLSSLPRVRQTGPTRQTSKRTSKTEVTETWALFG
jgi:hypothetical protein